MGTVVLDIAAARAGSLPAICVMCGAAAAHRKKVVYSWRRSNLWWVAFMAAGALVRACNAFGRMGGPYENLSASAEFGLNAKLALGVLVVWLLALVVTGRKAEAVLPFCEKDVGSTRAPTVNTITDEHLMLDGVSLGFIDATIQPRSSTKASTAQPANAQPLHDTATFGSSLATSHMATPGVIIDGRDATLESIVACVHRACIVEGCTDVIVHISDRAQIPIIEQTCFQNGHGFRANVTWRVEISAATPATASRQ